MRAIIGAMLTGALSLISSAALAEDRSRCEALNAGGPVPIEASLVPAGFDVPKGYYPAGNAKLHFGVGSIQIDGPGGEEVLRSNAVITSVGFLNQPNMPDIEGMESFKGRRDTPRADRRRWISPASVWR